MHKLKLHQDVIGAQSLPAHMKPRCLFLFIEIPLLPFPGNSQATAGVSESGQIDCGCNWRIAFAQASFLGGWVIEFS
jgi:hypothetical protein